MSVCEESARSSAFRHRGQGQVIPRARARSVSRSAMQLSLSVIAVIYFRGEDLPALAGSGRSWSSRRATPEKAGILPPTAWPRHQAERRAKSSTRTASEVSVRQDQSYHGRVLTKLALD